MEQRRKAALRQRQRFQEAWQKNFAYLLRKHETETQQLQERIGAAQQREVDGARKYQQIMEERRKRQQEQQKQQEKLQQKSQAGIGTQKRKRVEITKAAQTATTTTSNQTAALYITGIPRDQSISMNVIGDIFRAYGNVTKVNFYRDKRNGDLKGDGLIVYKVKTWREKEELTETVCTQVSPLFCALKTMMDGEAFRFVERGTYYLFRLNYC